MYCEQTAGWIKMPLGMEIGLGSGHVMLDGAQFPPPQKKRGTVPQFSAHVCFGQTAGLIKMPLGTTVAVGPGYILLDGDAAPQKGHSPPPPEFSAHVCCGQMAGLIKMPLGTEVGLGHIVLDGDPALLPKSGTALHQIFGPCLLWPNGRPYQLLLSTCEAGHGTDRQTDRRIDGRIAALFNAPTSVAEAL